SPTAAQQSPRRASICRTAALTSAASSWGRWPKSCLPGSIRRLARRRKTLRRQQKLVWTRPRSDSPWRCERRRGSIPYTLQSYPRELMARVTVEDCIEKVPNRFSLVLLAAHRARAISSGAPLLVDRDNDKNPVVALREIADDVVDAEELRESLIGTLQRVDERSEAEEEAETLALLADPTHMQMSELELVRALQSDRDGGQEERY